MSINWKENPLLLAEKLVARIKKEGEISIDALDAQAVKHGINMNTMDQALQLIHKKRIIEQKSKKGTIWYSIKVKKAPEPFKKFTYELSEYDKSIVADGAPIPFYDPEFDGPSPTYGKVHNDWCKKKNEEAKRVVERDTFQVKGKKQFHKQKPKTAEQLSLIDLFKTSE